MIKVRQAIVVEGRYDKNTLSQLVDATIFTTEGFGIFRRRDMVDFLRRVAKERGLIVLTDSDGAGFVIRNYLKSVLPEGEVLHAYIPDVYGKERRKTAPGKEGKLGVEGMDPQTLLDALRRTGAEIEGETVSAPRTPITKTDLIELGLSGGAESRRKRLQLQKRLGLPEHLSANGLLDALNLLYDRETFLEEAT